MWSRYQSDYCVSLTRFFDFVETPPLTALSATLRGCLEGPKDCFIGSHDLLDRAGRALADAERVVESVTRHSLCPRFHLETVPYPRSRSTKPPFNSMRRRSDWLYKSVELSDTFIAPGNRALRKLGTATLVYSDLDGDGYREKAIGTVELDDPYTPSSTTYSAIKAFYPDTIEEIRDPISLMVSFDDSQITATFDWHDVIDIDLLSRYGPFQERSVIDLCCGDFPDGIPPDGCPYLKTVDIYEEYIENEDSAVEMLFDDSDFLLCGLASCEYCKTKTLTGCVEITDLPHFVRPIATETSSASCVHGQPYSVSINYLGGNAGLLDPQLERAVFLLAASYMRVDPCDNCDCELTGVTRWKEISAEYAPSRVAPLITTVPFNTRANAQFQQIVREGTRGEMSAWSILSAYGGVY